MKYSFMTFSCPNLSLDETLAAARRFGYDGIEPRIASGHRHGIEPTASAAERAAARRKTAESGVALSCIATSHTYADPAKAEAQVKETLASVRLAADVGAPAVRVFGGRLPEGVTREQAIESVTSSLRTIAREIAGLGVTVCIETHDDWCDPVHLAEVMRRVNRPCIAVNWDIMHPVRMAGKSIEDSFAILRPWVRHVHFHDGVTRDGKLQMVPIGTGEIDHRAAVRLLQSAGYAGYLSGEWIEWEPWESHLPRELAVMKGYEAPVS